MKKFLFSLIGILLLSISSSFLDPVYSKGSTSSLPTISPSPTPQIKEEINSFEMFWPLVAGKTVDDGFVYPLKKLKENFRGMLIFGRVQKADYLVFLATKRVLEAEKLIKENKYKLANKTLDDALGQLSVAEKKIQGFSRPEKSSVRNKEIVGRAFNIEKLVVLLASQESGSSDKLREVADKASSIPKKLQD